jgi:hypothetical protein
MATLKKTGASQDAADAVIKVSVTGNDKDLTPAQIDLLKKNLTAIMDGYDSVLTKATDENRKRLEQQKPEVRVAATEILNGRLKKAETITSNLYSIGAKAAEELHTIANANKALNKKDHLISFFNKSISSSTAPQSQNAAPGRKIGKRQ